MALVATDRAPMLDTIVLEGSPRNTEHFPDRLAVLRNHEAEFFFRALGSLARTREIRHDPEFVRQLLDRQPLVTDKASNRVEDWFSRLVASLDKNTDYYQVPYS